MRALENKQWKVIDKDTGKTICILTAIEHDMFWIIGNVALAELYEKCLPIFQEISALHPENNHDLDKLYIAVDELAEKIEFESINHEHDIEGAILYIFEDMTAQFRAIWKD